MFDNLGTSKHCVVLVCSKRHTYNLARFQKKRSKYATTTFYFYNFTQAELKKLTEHFLESDDDLQEWDEENLSENVDACIELPAQKFQEPFDLANLDLDIAINNIPIIFYHELDGANM